jgi:predicted short-subunit dehydrogenase-like oxidoreductase (DUF2520 family)
MDDIATPDETAPMPSGLRLAVVGGGRMGNALVAALPGTAGPFGRGFDGDGFDAVVLAVPDREILPAATPIRPGRLVGHCAGSLGAGALAPHEAFAVHPLMTVTRDGADFHGAAAAVAGTSERALTYAHALAGALGLRAIDIADEDRLAYHAAASVASNFLVTLEDAAETLLATTGADRSILVPLVSAALRNWAAIGGPAAITGPIARGDDELVARQRDTIAERAPELLPMFDALAERTRAMCERGRPG